MPTWQTFLADHQHWVLAGGLASAAGIWIRSHLVEIKYLRDEDGGSAISVRTR